MTAASQKPLFRDWKAVLAASSTHASVPALYHDQDSNPTKYTEDKSTVSEDYVSSTLTELYF